MTTKLIIRIVKGIFIFLISVLIFIGLSVLVSHLFYPNLSYIVSFYGILPLVIVYLGLLLSISYIFSSYYFTRFYIVLIITIFFINLSILIYI